MYCMIVGIMTKVHDCLYKTRPLSIIWLRTHENRKAYEFAFYVCWYGENIRSMLIPACSKNKEIAYMRVGVIIN